MTPLDLGYIAGFFDGEGSVGIVRPKARNGKRYPKLRARIAQNQRDVLEWISATVGFGCVHTEKRLYGRERKLMHRFVVTDQQAERFLAVIRPYLRVKAVDVDAAVATLRKERKKSTPRSSSG